MCTKIKKMAVIKAFEAVIEANVGLTMQQIMVMDMNEIHRHIEKQKQCTLVYDDEPALDFRGNVLLANGLIDYDINAEFDKTFGIKR